MGRSYKEDVPLFWQNISAGLRRTLAPDSSSHGKRGKSQNAAADKIKPRFYQAPEGEEQRRRARDKRDGQTQASAAFQ
jgi:hypothetical protein